VLEGLIGNTSRKFGCRTDPMIDGWRVTGWRATLGRLSTHPLFPPIFSVLVATMCVRGVFSLSKIFYFRDLALYHWPHHRWMRRELLLGHSPFWDPNPGGGYATVGDAALHVLFLPTLPLRLLPEIVGFNLIIALPFPVAAIGVYLFARRHASPWGSAIAAIAYSASGPILSSANCNNIAWCVAIIPFIFWAIDGLVRKPSARRFGLLALLFALGGGNPAISIALGHDRRGHFRPDAGFHAGLPNVRHGPAIDSGGGPAHGHLVTASNATRGSRASARLWQLPRTSE
jgi:hypothetical protein